MRKYVFFISFFLIFLVFYSPPLNAGIPVQVGVYQNEPLVFSASDGAIKGIYIDVIEHVASKEGWDILYVPGSWSQCLERLMTGQIDILLGIAYSKERDERYDFTRETLLTNWGIIYTQEDSNIQSIPDLHDKTIAVLKDDVYYRRLENIMEQFNIVSNFIEANDYGTVFELVENGKADAGLITRLLGIEHEKNYHIKKSPIVCCPIELRFAVPEGKNRKLVSAIDRYLGEMKEDKGSIYYQSLNRWIEDGDRPLFPEWLKWALVLTGGLLILLLGGIIFLRYQIRARTEDLEKEISERERAEEILKETHDIISKSPAIAFLWKNEVGWPVEFVTDNVESIFGYTVEEFISGKIIYSETIHPDDLARVEKEVQGFNKEKDREGYALEPYRIVTKDGKERWVEDKTYIRRDKTGRITHHQGIVEDITERKQTEEALRENEAFLQSIFDGIQDGISVLDSELNIIRVNEWMEKVYSEKMPVIGKKCYEAYQGRKSVCPWCPSLKVLETGEAHSETVPYPFADKPAGGFELSSFPIKDAAGKVEGVIEHVKDIADRIKAEEALIQEQEKFRILVEESPLGVSFIDKNSRYQYINPKFIEIFGYTLEDIPDGRAWFKRAFPDAEYRSKVILTWLNDLEKSEVGVGRPQSFDVRCKDGSEKVIYFRSVTMKTGEQFILYEDITLQKKLEAQFQQAQKMEAVGTLAGGIAHDFNNLLQSILGYSQLLLFKKKKEDPEFDKLKEIEKATQRASELTLQLLTFSRKVESKLKPVNLNHQVQHVYKLLKRTIPKMIDIELHLEENLKITNADPAQIEQLLMNLAVNARDAIHEEGKLTIETENVNLDEDYCKTHLGTSPGDYVLLIVSDTGHGMDRETAERIFEPFFTTKGTGKGTGLGLSMVYGIVNSHGGYITCYSEPGEGTTFKIYLPVIKAAIAEKAADKNEEEMPAGGSEGILLVDDEEFLRNLGEEILAKFGYRIFTAPDAESALTLYREKKENISLIILDLIMPGMGGRRCLEELIKTNPQVKVVIASGYSVNGHAKEALDAGAKGFIDKPYNVKQMLKKVREVLDGH